MMIQIRALVLLCTLVWGCSGIGSTGKNGQVTDPLPVFHRTWLWEATLTPTDKIIVPDSERYTLLLTPHGQAQFRFDCNRGSGNYQISTGKLRFGPMISTRMACPPESQDIRFMRELQRIETFFVRDGKLYLVMPDESGSMQFRQANGKSSK